MVKLYCLYFHFKYDTFRCYDFYRGDCLIQNDTHLDKKCFVTHSKKYILKGFNYQKKRAVIELSASWFFWYLIRETY